MSRIWDWEGVERKCHTMHENQTCRDDEDEVPAKLVATRLVVVLSLSGKIISCAAGSMCNALLSLAVERNTQSQRGKLLHSVKHEQQVV